MAKTNKHLRIAEPIVSVIELYAKKSMRNKSAAYEIALKTFISARKQELIDLGIPDSTIEKAENAD